MNEGQTKRSREPSAMEIIHAMAHELRRLRLRDNDETNTNPILQRIEQKVDQMAITVEQVKLDVAEIRSSNAEALAELASRINDLDAQIAVLVSQVANPTISDAVFEENLAAAKTSSGQLKDIVSSVPTPPNT